MTTPKPRVLYAGWQYDAGVQQHGPSYEYTNFVPSLRRSTAELHIVTLDESTEIGPVAIGRRIEQAVDEVKPDLLFCCLVHDDIDPESLRRIRDGGVTAFNWFCDDHWRFESFSSRWAPEFDYVSTTDEDSLPRYAAIGYDRALRTQWAVDETVYHPQGRALEHSVSFVGQAYGDRPAVLRRVSDAGIPLLTLGTGWRVRPWHRVAAHLPVVSRLGGRQWAQRVRASTRVDVDRMVEVYETSAVNLNFAAASHGGDRQIKARVFEVPAAGGFLLTQKAPYLERYLRPDDEIGVFDDEDELVDAIRWWLAHDTERADAARRARDRVRGEHTYIHRFAELFARMGLG